MTDLPPTDKSVLVDHIERNLWELWANYGKAPGGTLHDEPDVTWYETPLPIIPYNGVLRFQVRDDPGSRIQAIVEHFARRGVPLIWFVHPTCLPRNLPALLTAHGLTDIEPVYGMARSLADLPAIPELPDGIEIRKASDDNDLDAFYDFASWRWNIPVEHQPTYRNIISSQFKFGKPDSSVHMWQAWRSGQPIAKAIMYHGSESAGLYGVVTRPEARRLGLARILTLAALHHARESGYQISVLHSTPMAEEVYQSAGYETVAEFRLFGSGNFQV